MFFVTSKKASAAMTAYASAAESTTSARSENALFQICTRCTLFAVFAAMFWAIPIGTMAAIVGNADFQAQLWMAQIWAALTLVTILGGAALYATFAFSYEWCCKRQAHSDIAARFQALNIEDPEKTLDTSSRPRRSNVVHAEFGARSAGFPEIDEAYRVAS